MGDRRRRGRDVERRERIGGRDSDGDGEGKEVSTIAEPAVELGVVREGRRVASRRADDDAIERRRIALSRV